MVYNNTFEYFVDNDRIVILSGVNPDIEELIIPSHINRFPVVEIEQNAFRGYSKLKEIHLPEKLSSIGRYAFESCISLKNITCLCENVELASAVFRNCSNLEVFRAANIVSLERQTFAHCNRLRSFQGEICKIGYKTFEDCISLHHSLIFAEHVYRFHGGAFRGCDNLSHLVFNGCVDVADSMDNDDLLNFTILCEPDCIIAELAYLGVNVDTDCGEILPF